MVHLNFVPAFEKRGLATLRTGQFHTRELHVVWLFPFLYLEKTRATIGAKVVLAMLATHIAFSCHANLAVGIVVETTIGLCILNHVANTTASGVRFHRCVIKPPANFC